MSRERALKVVLMLVGLLFSAGIYPTLQKSEARTPQMSIQQQRNVGIPS